MRALLVVLLVLVGCSDGERVRKVAEQVREAPVSLIGEESPNMQDARRQLAEAQAAVAAARARVDELEQQAQEARIEGLRRLLHWASGLAVLGMLACAALAIWLPLWRKRLALAAVACAVVLGIAQAAGPLLGWLPLIGAGIVLVALAAVTGAMYLRLRAAVRSVDAAVDRDDPTWPAMREHLMRAQGGEGRAVQRDLDRIARRERERERRAGKRR